MAERGGLRARLRRHLPFPIAAEIGCAPGELVALIGPSGGGKTTMLRAIAGLERSVAGEIRCAGETWLDSARGLALPAQRRRVGFVFQDYALFPHLSALGNVAIALGHLGAGARRARARELLAAVHLEGLEERRPAELSGGQRQRVALARALAREPAVLLLDEPFSAVDQVTRRRLQRELVLLRRRFRIPTVLVTHDLEEARALADRLIAIDRGASLQEGTPAELHGRPANARVARLMDLGNLFEGRVVEQRRDPARTVIEALGTRIEARAAPRFAPGERVLWVVPEASVIMHRRRQPSRGERENPLRGRLEELLVLGDRCAVRVRVGAGAREVVRFAVSAHVAARNGLAVGVDLAVSLVAEGIHLMPWEAPEGGHPAGPGLPPPRPAQAVGP